jgi:hypothetical protein
MERKTYKKVSCYLEECGASEPRVSEIAKDLAQLKDTVISVTKRRDELPREMFWSLFHSEISSIRQRKHKKRIFTHFFN